jgi:hypothetical protein
MCLLPKSKSVETVCLIADSIGSRRGEVAMRLQSVETVSLIADSIGSSRGEVAMCLPPTSNLLRLSL